MSDYKIAVYISASSGMADFLKSDTFKIYTFTDGAWVKERTEAFEPVDAGSVQALRKSTQLAADRIADCGIVAGIGLSGIPFSVFDLRGFHIFSVEGIDDATLNGIVADIEKGDIELRMREEIINNAKPAETDIPGYYYLDLVMLQTECPDISSKKAMMEFLENTPFIELKLICKHVPPWIENSGKYDIKTEARGVDFIAIIKKKSCSM